MAVQDDEEAFRMLFFHFFPALCVFAGRYIDQKAACEDVVQETFLKIWTNRKRIEITSSARNFLITSVRNSCIDYLRTRQAEGSFQRITPDMDESSFATDDTYTITELENMIQTAINRLPENIRTVFIRNRFEGETYAEIAQRSNISVKTVEAYMTKALKHLRTELKDYLPFMVLFL